MESFQPRYLQAGDKVALVSPSYSPKMEDVTKAADTLRSWGLDPIIGPNVGQTYSKYAGTVEERVSDLRWALLDPGIKAIICNRGGYGAIQLIEHLNLSEWDIQPKWLVGFSDSTTLHGLFNHHGIMSIHGNMSSSIAKDDTNESNTLLRNLLMGTVPCYQLPAHPQNITGKANGILVGGNICSFVPILRTEADAMMGDDLILFIEEVSESMHNIDRQLNILALNGVLDRCKGVVLGEFTKCKDELKSLGSIEQMVCSYLKKYDIPVLCGFPAGHGNVNVPILLGAPTTIDVRQDGATLQFNAEGQKNNVEVQVYNPIESSAK